MKCYIRRKCPFMKSHAKRSCCQGKKTGKGQLRRKMSVRTNGRKGLLRKTAGKKRYDWFRKALSSSPESGYSKRYGENLTFVRPISRKARNNKTWLYLMKPRHAQPVLAQFHLKPSPGKVLELYYSRGPRGRTRAFLQTLLLSSIQFGSFVTHF